MTSVALEVDHSIDQSVDQSVLMSVNHSISQSINRSIATDAETSVGRSILARARGYGGAVVSLYLSIHPYSEVEGSS
jgi:hypothetical protein